MHIAMEMTVSDRHHDLMQIDYAIYQLSEAIDFLSDVTLTFKAGPFPASEVERAGTEASRLLNIVRMIPIKATEAA